MKTPKTPIEFDYDLWTTEDGKCMVRVKITGEVTEVDRKVMRILRAEEKRLRRSKQGVPISGTEGKTAEERASVLSLSYVSYEGCEDLEPYWLIDSSSMEESVMFWMSEKEFRATLTPKQLDIYLNCIIGGQSKIDYAAANNMQRQSVYNAATLILIKPHYVTESFPKLLKAKGMRQIRYHDLRHSCASLLLANGVPMKQIQEWLGHSDFSTTANIYAHLDYSSKLTSADAMLNGLGFAQN